ncbi:zinc finger protein 518A [Erpetoichthys calabaricus]|uniref:zinc finger protein 518A n=1 Tax=Erpetoichthys calabaricus TaxID=27687 RepID=UPI002233F4E3|nr:zinc finger protein 518A [Erpetoichthys calabaricus]
MEWSRTTSSEDEDHVLICLTQGTNDVEGPEVNLSMHPVLRSLATDQAERSIVSQTARKSFKNLYNNESMDISEIQPVHPRTPEKAVLSAKVLQFRCSECEGNTLFSPNDLMKHYKSNHYGFLPIYPCNLCSFSANDFQILQQHRLIHRNTLVKCDVCKDDVQYTLLQLTRHFTMRHCVNGYFRCEKCKFSTKDVGTFVQHIHRHNEIQYRCGKCQHVSYTKGEFQKHLLVHTGAFPFNCQFCDYGATRKDYVIKHIYSLHSDQFEQSPNYLQKEDVAKCALNNSAGLKFMLKRSSTVPLNEVLWQTKDPQDISGNDVAGECERLNIPKITARETPPFLGRTANNEKGRTASSCIVKNEPPNASDCVLSQITMESTQNHNSGLLKSNINGSSVLYLKNKISVPPNCTTKFMGFKMVGGKKHLVLKVVPVAKAEHSTPSLQSSISGESESDLLNRTHEDTVGVMTKGVPQEQSSQQLRRNFSLGKIHRVRGDLNPDTVKEPSTMFHKIKSEPYTPAVSLTESAPMISHTVTELTDMTTHSSGASQFHKIMVKQEKNDLHVFPDVWQQSGNVSITVENMDEDSCLPNPESRQVFSFHNYSKDTALNRGLSLHPESLFGMTECNEIQNPCSILVSETIHARGTSPGRSAVCSDLHVKKYSQHFSGHKHPEAYEVSENEEVEEINHVASQLNSGRYAEPSDEMCSHDNSPLMPKITSVFSLKNECDSEGSDLDVSQIVERVIEKERKKSLMPEVNKKGCMYSGTRKGSPATSASLDQILGKHSNAIIHQQLEKEHGRPSGSVELIQSLNLPESKHILLHPSSNGSSIPFQFGNRSGFKLIRGTSLSQINESEKPESAPGLKFAVNNGRLQAFSSVKSENKSDSVSGVTLQGAGKRMFPSRLQKSSGTGHILLNGKPLKGSLVVSKSVPSLCTETASKVPTCFLVKPQVSTGTAAVVKGCSSNKQQAFLLKCLTPIKSNLLLNSQATGLMINREPSTQESGSNAQKVLLKIVRSTAKPNSVCGRGEPLRRGASVLTADMSHAVLQTVTQANRSIVMAADTLAASSMLMSQNQSSTEHLPPNSRASKRLACTVDVPLKYSLRANAQNKEKDIPAIMNSVNKRSDSQRLDSSSLLTARRKRQKRLVTAENIQEHPKTKKILNKNVNESDEVLSHEVGQTLAPKDVVRTLRLVPFNRTQVIKCPRRNQPVVVLNHPDADPPEIVNVMKTVSKFKGHVLKVALSQRTIAALSEAERNFSLSLTSQDYQTIRGHKIKAISPVKERFVLKLKLKKTSRNKYKVVNSTSVSNVTSTFSCWFCGRLFDNQEQWIGHGQRHLMEATRDWNLLL